MAPIIGTTVKEAINFFKNSKQTLLVPNLGTKLGSKATVAFQDCGSHVKKIVFTEGGKKTAVGSFTKDGKLMNASVETSRGIEETIFRSSGELEGLKNAIKMKPKEPVGDVREFSRLFDGPSGRLSTPHDFYEPLVGYTKGIREGEGQYNREFNAVHNFIVNG